MREVKRSALVNKPPAELFALINDIESYPQFLPWCTHARVRVALADARSSRRSACGRGRCTGSSPPATRSSPTRGVRMQLVSGPFRTLEGEWLLTPIEGDGCRVELTMRFAFSNRLTRAAVRAAVRRDHRLAGGCIRRPRAGASVSAPAPPRKRCTVAYATRERQYLWQRRAGGVGHHCRGAGGGARVAPRVAAPTTRRSPGTSRRSVFSVSCARAATRAPTAIGSSCTGRSTRDPRERRRERVQRTRRAPRGR